VEKPADDRSRHGHDHRCILHKSKVTRTNSTLSFFQIKDICCVIRSRAFFIVARHMVKPCWRGRVGTVTDKNLRVIHEERLRIKGMPAEISDVDEFVALSAKAKFCSVKRLKEAVKLKLRTPSRLYTLKVEPLRADEIIKKLKCEIREI